MMFGLPNNSDSDSDKESRPIINLTIDLTGLDPEDIVSLFILACDQGQYGEAHVIRKSLNTALDSYEEFTRMASDEDDDDDHDVESEESEHLDEEDED